MALTKFGWDDTIQNQLQNLINEPGNPFNQVLNTTSEVTFEQVTTDTIISSNTLTIPVTINGVELLQNDIDTTGVITAGQFSLDPNAKWLLSGSDVQVHFDTGDRLDYDRTANQFNFFIAGNPQPDLRVGQGQLWVNDKIDNVTPGDLVIGSNSSANISLQRPLQFTSVTQDDTATQILSRDGSNNVKWRDATTLGVTTGTHNTTWTFPGDVGGGTVQGNIVWTKSVDNTGAGSVTLRMPTITKAAVLGESSAIFSDTALPADIRPLQTQSYLRKAANNGVSVISEALVEFGGQIYFYADINAGLFTGFGGNHQVFATSFSYNL